MQELYLEILKRSFCNDFNGQFVYDSLMSHRDLWLSIYPVREAGGESVTLLDLVDDEHSIDCIYIYTTNKEMETLVRTWGADEVDWINKQILRVWFD